MTTPEDEYVALRHCPKCKAKMIHEIVILRSQRLVLTKCRECGHERRLEISQH